MRIAIALATVILAGGQGGPESYAGTWTADLAGQTFVRLELKVANGALGGRISLGNIHVDAEGEIDLVNSVARNFTPVDDLVLGADSVSFTRKDGDDTDHFELHVAPDGSVRLTFVPTEEDRAELAREGIPVPKPIVLKKVAR
jgi:hypothetical protein